MDRLKKISSKEIALAIGKTPPAITYLKQKHENEFNILKLGVLCTKLQLDDDDLVAIYKLKRSRLKDYLSDDEK